MKLSAKLISVVLLVFTVLLAADATLMVNREQDLLQTDAEQDALFLGRVLQSMLATAIQLGGPGRLDSVIDGLNQGERVQVQWVALPGDRERELASLDDASRQELEQGGVVLANSNSGAQMVTLFRVSVDGTAGLARVTEFGVDSGTTVRAFRRRFMLLAGVALVTSALLVGLAGTVLVGRPLQRLTAYARGIGEGDLSGRLELKRSDELGELASAMNQMSLDLREARDRVRQETEARIEALHQLRHEDRLRTLGRLAAGMAHELGTPLNVILGRAGMISSGNLSQSDVVKSAEIIRNMTSRMTGIIRQLLDFARRRPPKKVTLDLSSLVRQVASLLEPMARKCGVTVEVQQGEGPTRASVDTGQIQQVVTNLAMNAIQAMPKGGTATLKVDRTPATKPGSSEARDCLRIRLSDEGYGIAEKDLPHLFEPFFTTKEVGEGSGLGLSIAHGMVQEHNGWITVESEVGKGSTFSIFLPEAGES